MRLDAQARRPRPAAAPVGIDLWMWPLEVGQAEGDALEELLSADERVRALRYHLAHDRRQFIVGRARLRQILADYAASPPETLEFCYGEQGKPALSGHRSLCFNLSHSGGCAALAVAGCDVGIDIEEVRPIDRRVAQRFFSADENAVLDRLCEGDWLHGFYRCWTRKEAVLKALGSGLSLAAAEATDGGPCLDGAVQWSIVDLALSPPFVGAIAARTMGAQAAIRRRWQNSRTSGALGCNTA